MRYMNDHDIARALDMYRNHPLLGPATRTLASLRDAADANSDGWCYWPKPARAAAKLMELIERDGTARYLFDTERADVTEAELRKALTPIKTFRTTSGLKFTIYEPGEPAALEVRTTIAVSVTVKIDAVGSTPDQLVTNATLRANEVIEGALTSKYSKYPETNGRYEWCPGRTISVEGATALVNRTALEALFHNDQEN